jgi:hypothetical protein
VRPTGLNSKSTESPRNATPITVCTKIQMVYVQAPTRTSWLLLRCSVGSIGRRAGRHHRAGIARVRFAVDEAGPGNNGGVDMTAKLITSPGLSPGVMGGPFLTVRGEPEPLGRSLTS